MRSWWLVLLVVCIGPAAWANERVLDDFRDPSAWTLSASDDVKASLHPGPDGSLCMDFDFGNVTGYVVARRRLALDIPPRFEFTLGVRGDAAPNDLQFKLLDASGENVWWARRPDFKFPTEARTLTLRQRQFEFAWGPTSDRTLRHVESLELVVASGTGAGKGSACFDRLVLRDLSDRPDGPPPPVAIRQEASTITLDFGQPREFGELLLRWQAGRSASAYDIEASDDGQTWRLLRHVDRARGDVHRHWLPDSEARFARLVLRDAGTLAGAELAETATANAYFTRLANDAPRGAYPRAFHGEQAYWTVFGVEAARTAALIGEDGAIEPLPGVGALEPFLIDEGRRVTWADARITQTLRDGDLPMPSVLWRTDTLALRIDAFATGTPKDAQAIASYTVHNLTQRTRDVTLALAWRPFQVNPPTQFLAHAGGVSVISEMAWTGIDPVSPSDRGRVRGARTAVAASLPSPRPASKTGEGASAAPARLSSRRGALRVNGVVRLSPLVAPDAVRFEPLAAGPASEWMMEVGGAPSLTPRPLPQAAEGARDDAGFASAVLSYRLKLAPGEARRIAVALPFSGAPATPSMADLPRLEAATANHWRQRLGKVRLTGPPPVADIAATLRAALGHILVNRSGAALQPGARAYARSWIRDGALTSSALLRLGHGDVARDFLLWYAPFQFRNGKVPCCATERGADPVPENDSDGEFVFAAADLWRHTRDEATARKLWPNVEAAVTHMEALRASERTDANRSPGRAAYFGLMPPSISHEGYSDRPAYSYWDDFWAYTGYRSAVQLAQGLGHANEAATFTAHRDEFLVDLQASLVASTRAHGLDVLPGAADRGDVDPTSSTIALTPAGLLGALPGGLAANTFERYWRNFTERRDSGKPWPDYTPYEWRNVGALVRLGQRERALQAMDFFYRDRRPAGWKQWAEVVGRDPREPRFLGDMPHGWVASDHIRAVLDLFAYEDETRQTLVLAAGVPMAWFDGPGLSLAGLRTPYGPLGWRARATHGGGRATITFDLQALRDAPPGGIELRGPWPADARVSVNGRRVAGDARRIALAGTPARVRVEWP